MTTSSRYSGAAVAGIANLQFVVFHGSVVKGKELGQRLPNEKMSSGQERAVRIVVRKT